MSGSRPVPISLALLAGSLVIYPVGAKPDYSEKENREISDEFADCVVRKNYEKAREFVGKNLDEEVVLRQFRALNDGNCLVKAANAPGGVKMSFPTPYFRYAMARALVRRDYPNNAFADFKAVPAFAAVDIRPLDETRLPKSKVKADELRRIHFSSIYANEMSKFGECVVRASPATAHAFMISKQGTPDRTTAIAALKPFLAHCLANGTVKFDAFYLNGALAVNYYRLAFEAKQLAPQVVGGKTT